MDLAETRQDTLNSAEYDQPELLVAVIRNRVGASEESRKLNKSVGAGGRGQARCSTELLSPHTAASDKERASSGNLKVSAHNLIQSLDSALT